MNKKELLIAGYQASQQWFLPKWLNYIETKFYKHGNILHVVLLAYFAFSQKWDLFFVTLMLIWHFLAMKEIFYKVLSAIDLLENASRSNRKRNKRV